jgi:hypothetical protein
MYYLHLHLLLYIYIISTSDANNTCFFIAGLNHENLWTLKRNGVKVRCVLDHCYQLNK